MTTVERLEKLITQYHRGLIIEDELMSKICETADEWRNRNIVTYDAGCYYCQRELDHTTKQHSASLSS